LSIPSASTFIKSVAGKSNTKHPVILRVGTSGKYCLRALKAWEVAALYGINKKTLNKELTPFRDEIGSLHGQFYLIPQVKKIFEKLGVPGFFEID
jgi:hypothetical protein